jgi:SAM-dependent methyltransferase
LDRTYPGNQSESGLRTAVSESGARALAAGIANLSFRQGDGRDLPLPDARFDLAVPHTVLSHVPDPQVVLAEAFRILRPGGTLAVFDGDYSALSVATSDTDPFQACAVAFIQHFVHDRWIIRRLPATVCAAGFTNARLRSHGYAQAASPAYLLSISTAAPAPWPPTAASARNSPRRSRPRPAAAPAPTPFGHIAHASLTARKPG